jgi:hypothetical protein
MKLMRRAFAYFWNLHLVQVLRLRLGKSHAGTPLRRLPYVFIIGFNRAGTRSLHNFFQSAGLPSVHWDENKLVRRMLLNLRRGKRLLSGYDSRFLVYSDLILADPTRMVEGNQFFRRLFDEYPGSLFILNTRPTAKWVDSRLSHLNGEFLVRYMNFTGTDDPSEVMALWKSQKERHEAEVREFFSDKPGRLVEVNIEVDNVADILSNFIPFRIEGAYWTHVGKSRHDTESSLARATHLSQVSEAERKRLM